ncbi:MAG: hypothetical protein Ct9H300mP16_13730 [Pseudomonadota bacterium]|nr:MAG: hypothetical protein Ct9H300mP16_13730 [Pseudomonadota bacterium]
MSGSIWPITCRAVTGAGARGSTQEPGSALTSKQASDPALFGLRCHDAFEAEGRIRIGIALGRIDSITRSTRRTVVIQHSPLAVYRQTRFQLIGVS